MERENLLSEFIKNNEEELYSLLRDLCAIPAPSYKEDARAEFCRDWLLKNGASGVYIDRAKNVIFPYQCENSDKITALAAHTDTVFPDESPLPYREENGKIYCPGVGDNTASVVMLLLTAKFFIENNIETEGGVLFVCNSCEEGLGNLFGTRTFMKEYEGRIKQFLAFDTSSFSDVHDKCVGSHRYEIEVKTEGGHSYLAFGNRNAALSLAEIITELYKIEIPQKENTKTTLNVGTIEGGTSVNTIPESAKMLCEYRSNDVECLDYMKEQFMRVFDRANCEHTQVNVKLIGERPCEKGTNKEDLQTLVYKCQEIIETVTNQKTETSPSSTDCNIPLSLGIPAICIGVYNGEGMHTRGEWLYKDSLPIGLEVGIKMIERMVK